MLFLKDTELDFRNFYEILNNCSRQLYITILGFH